MNDMINEIKRRQSHPLDGRSIYQMHDDIRLLLGIIERQERVFVDLCDEIGCAYDNEAALMAVDELKRRATAS